MNVNVVLMADSEAEDQLPDSHYMKPYWAHATTSVRIENRRDPVVALINHGLETNLMSKDLYQKGKWPITKDHGWKIRAATTVTEHLFVACPSVPVKVGDIEIGQNFFL